MTFINKLDREGKDPIELLDEVETVLGIQCAPVTWPIGMGQRLKGVVHLLTGEVHLYEPGRNFTRQDSTIFPSIDAPGLAEKIGAQMLADLRDELELVQGASHPFDLEAYRAGKQTRCSSARA
jgi:peptide chain release factor 3